MRTASRIVGAFSGAALVRRWSGRRAVGHRRSLSSTPAENWRKESDRKRVETTGITFRVRLIGLEVVEGPYDENGCRRTLRKYGKAGNKQTHPILLSLSSNKVQVIQFPWFVACEHTVTAISACYTDSRRPRLFAYIVKDYKTDSHLCLAFKTLRRTGVSGSRLEQAFGHAFECCVERSPGTSVEESMYEQKVAKSGQSNLFRSNVHSHFSAADLRELSHQSQHLSTTPEPSTVNNRGSPSVTCKAQLCSEQTLHQNSCHQKSRHLVRSISDGFLFGIRMNSPSLPQSQQTGNSTSGQTLEHFHMDTGSDEVQCLTVENGDDDGNHEERVAGNCSNGELVSEDAVSSVLLSESNSWCRCVDTPSLDQLVIPRGSGQEDLHLSPPPQLERQTGYINLPDALMEDMYTESRVECSMSYSCLFIPNSVTNRKCSDINYAASFPNRKAHKGLSAICSRHEDQETDRTSQVKETKSGDDSSTPPDDLSDTDPPLSPLHAPQYTLPIPWPRQNLLSQYKAPSPLPSPPVPPRWASLRRNTKSTCSYYSTPKLWRSPSSTRECSHHSATVTRGSSITSKCSDYPCPMPEYTIYSDPTAEEDDVSASMSHSYAGPGHLFREPSLKPPPVPPKTYKSSLPLNTVGCASTTTDSPTIPAHRKRENTKCSSPATHTTQIETCGHGTCSMCRFKEAALQASQLLHTLHTPPHAHTTGATLNCFIATWQS